jgi:glycine cleavage system aminomethyltransferase T
LGGGVSRPTTSLVAVTRSHASTSTSEGRGCGWREEVRSWKDAAYLGAFLSLSPTYRVKGPDAERFFSEHFVNNFTNLRVGGSRHGIMCDARGRIMMDGTVLRVADDEYIAIWLSPYIQYAFEQGGYDASART